MQGEEFILLLTTNKIPGDLAHEKITVVMVT